VRGRIVLEYWEEERRGGDILGEEKRKGGKIDRLNINMCIQVPTSIEWLGRGMGIEKEIDEERER